jgi:pyruvate/2-oxoglutarate dehydrogenase complex dihydrolipoamide dehydrogenase (E3) component
MVKGTAFDLVVIGAGAAGSTVASAAAERGYAVALIEQGKVGGTCLNTGCDPTKTLVRAAEIAHLARTAGRFGIDVGTVSVDWPSVRARVAEVIETIRGGDGEQNIRDQGITLIKAHGRFVDPATVVAGDHRLRAERFLIATGARAAVPRIAGLERAGYLTSDHVPELERLPESMVIVGGGPIGVEFAQIFARLGVEVTLAGSRPCMLPREEPELCEALADVLVAEGIRWEPNLRIRHATRRGGRKVVRGERGGDMVELEAAEIMVATGRSSNIDRLGLEDAGIQANDHAILVDSQLRTSNPIVYAAGDVTGIYNFTHVADYQARIVEHNIFDDEQPVRADYRVVPWVTYADPELARVGLTEEEARAGCFDVVTATVPFADMPRALTLGERAGMVKLVVDGQSRSILGGHILGSRAGELIGEVAMAMERRLPVDAIASTIHPYPTMSEGVFWAAWQVVSELAATPVAAHR